MEHIPVNREPYDGCYVCPECGAASRKPGACRGLGRKAKPEVGPKNWKWLGGIISEMGKSRGRIVCECGTTNTVYIWSWSGHGHKRCEGCGGKLSRTNDTPNQWVAVGLYLVGSPCIQNVGAVCIAVAEKEEEARKYLVLHEQGMTPFLLKVVAAVKQPWVDYLHAMGDELRRAIVAERNARIAAGRCAAWEDAADAVLESRNMTYVSTDDYIYLIDLSSVDLSSLQNMLAIA